MKVLLSIILFLAISESFCLLKTKAKKAKQELLPIPTDLDKFPEAILTEINQYLSLYSKPSLISNEELLQTAQSAVEEILAHNTFGQHSKIEEWQSKLPNDIFTEMCFNVNVTNSNYYSKSLSSKTQKVMYDTKMSVGTIMKSPIAPTPQMFAKNIIEALESEHLLLTLDQYSSCGIAVKEMDQTKFPNEYLVVLHLIKPKEQSDMVFTSCLDAKSKGVTDENIEITINGAKQAVKCLNEYDGGWTLIHTENKDYGIGTTLEINDKGLEYNEVLIKTGPQWSTDFYTANTPLWLSNGYNIHFQALKFGGYYSYQIIDLIKKEKWYTTNDPNILAVHGISHYTINNLAFFPLSDVQIYSKPTTCNFDNTNHPDFCGTALSIKKQGGERVNAVSDLEFLSVTFGADDKIYYDFQMFVR